MALHQHRFTDRADAAHQLAAALSGYRGQHPLVLAIPRGGVPIGRVIADELDGDLDVVLVRKLGAPQNPELAVGAVDENGRIQVSAHAPHLGANENFIVHQARRELQLIRERRVRYTPDRRPLDPAGRTVIIVDDGLATGATMRSALTAVRAQRPQRLVCAVPVAAPDSLAAVSRLADDVVCLAAPAQFYAVGQFYDDFSATDDDEVVSLLAEQGFGAPNASTALESSSVQLPLAHARLEGDLDVPDGASGLIIFAHGSGSSRRSPRNRFVARQLNRHGLATLLFDLLTEEEDRDRSTRFDIALLTERLGAAVEWARRQPALQRLPVGLFGASTGAAAALAVAAKRPDAALAVVSRGGRPDLAGRDALARVAAPTLLIVGGADPQVLQLNEAARAEMRCRTDIAIVPGATHLFEEPGTLERVAELAAEWFGRWLVHAGRRTA